MWRLTILFCSVAWAQTGDFDSYARSVEARVKARPVNTTGRIEITAAPGNPVRVKDGLIHDWTGSVFLRSAKLDRTVGLLQDYDHRARIFKDIVASSKLVCRPSEEQFRVQMRLKEPVELDVENDVVWRREDDRHWTSDSRSISVREVGKDHGYVRRLNSYWRFSETADGVLVEAETVTLSDSFGSAARALGSVFGISPEKSLRKTLEAIREQVLRPGVSFEKSPAPAPCR
jgi:hypothetical protein